nr:dnl-type zinc finger protein [Quercus suber]
MTVTPTTTSSGSGCGSGCRLFLPSTRCRRRLLAVSQFVEDSSQSEEPNTTDAKIDIKLPRRSLLVQFTCDVCGERTERLINRLAYERGLVYIQCAGCLRHHKLVDNLGLLVEYDLREEINPDSNIDQV